MTGTTLIRLMRVHKVNIAQLAKRLGTTQKRVRQIRQSGIENRNVVRDWLQAITGSDPGPV